MIDQFLLTKRSKRKHTAEEIASFVEGVVDGTVSRPQAAAWLAFAFVQGLDKDEAVALTRAMTDSGDKLSWPGLDGPFIDKHSTGGVGDKVSLILAPLWAELGWRVPMISGRGLGHTGGTLDKLESIPGYRTDLDDVALRHLLAEVGCFITGQTAALAPADRILYALRNETQTVECIPLIVASILSKKLAAGLQRLVLDVKCGSGAFMKDAASARALAEALVEVGNGAGVRTSAMITDMSQPLGEACGNALEVQESIDCLKGGGPEDLRRLVVALAGHPDAERVLASGAAFARFEAMVAGQGGDLRRFTTGSVVVEEMVAEQAGVLTRCDAYEIGRAAFVLGAGRLRAEDAVDFRVGVTVKRKVGERVDRGDVLALLHHEGRNVELARSALRGAMVIGEKASPAPLIQGIVGAAP